MTDKEIEQLAKIEYDCWKYSLAPELEISDYLYYRTVISIKKEIQKLLDDETHHIITSQKKYTLDDGSTENKIIGFLITTFNPRKNMLRNTIEKFYVLPEYQNQNIGTALLKTMITYYPEYPLAMKVPELCRPIQHILIKNDFEVSLKRNEFIEYGKNKIPIKYVWYRRKI